MNVGQTEEGYTLSPLGSQDSAITSTSVSTEPIGSPISKATDGASSSTQEVSESEVSSTSVSGNTSWNLPSATVEDKNPFSWMSEEDLSQIDAVLSTEEGKLILQQTGGHFKMEDMEEEEEEAFQTISTGGLESPMLADSSRLSDTSNNVDVPTDPFLSTSLFDQSSLLSVTLDTSEMPSVLLQGDELEFEAESSFTDHAYCLTPKKRGSRSMADPDEKVADLQDTERIEVEEMVVTEVTVTDDPSMVVMEQEPVSRRGRRGRGRGRGGARRSTRIQDNEERQQAEIIRQENIRKEQEAMQAIQGSRGKIPVIKSYHMRTRSPRQNEGWATVFGKRKGKRMDQSGNEDSQDTGEEEQYTEGPTDADERTLDESESVGLEEEEEEEEDEEEKEGEDALKGKKIILRGKKAARGRKGRGKPILLGEDSEQQETRPPTRGRGKGVGKRKGKGPAASQEDSEEGVRGVGGRGGAKVGRQTRTALAKAAGATATKARAKPKGPVKGAKKKGKVQGQEESEEDEVEEEEEGKPKVKGNARARKAGKVTSDKAESDSEESDEEGEKVAAPKRKKKAGAKAKKGAQEPEDSESEEKAEEADDEGEDETKIPKKAQKGKKAAGATATEDSKGPKKKGKKGEGAKAKGGKGKKAGTAVSVEGNSSEEDVPLTQLKISTDSAGNKVEVDTEGELVIAETPDEREATDTDAAQGSDRKVSRRMIRGGRNKEDSVEEEEIEGGESNEEEDESDGFVDDENDEDWNSDNDPDRLWCLCQQPYDNRFMISCDTCEDWYHGSCVGITRTQGKAIERSNGGWTCPPCCQKRKNSKTKAKKAAAKAAPPAVKALEEDAVKVELSAEMDTEPELVTIEISQEEVLQEEMIQEVVIQEEVTQEETGVSPDADHEHMQDSTPVKTDKKVDEQISPSEKARLQRHQHQDAALQDKFKRLKQRRIRKETDKGDDDSKPVKKKKKVKAGGLQSQCIVGGCSNSARPNSVYCSNACIVKHADESLRMLEKQNKKMYGNRPRPEERQVEAETGAKAGEVSKQAERIIVLERSTGKILTGPTAPTATTLQAWLEKHPTYEVLTGSNPETFYGTKKDQKKEGKEKAELKKDMGKEIQAIKEKWQKRERERRERERLEKERLEKERRQKIREKIRAQNQEKASPEKKAEMARKAEVKAKVIAKPQREVKVHHGSEQHHRKVEVSPRVQQRELEVSQKVPQREGLSEEKPQGDVITGPDPVRLNVRKALKDSLTARADEADDILLSGSEIKQIAMAIEDELFRCFGAVTAKYKNRYRSLIFNIKDSKNKGLFRKILNGGIQPAHLARLSSEELASKELAKWREHETKHTLELIEIAEKEAALAGHVVKKTHKGELLVGDEDLSDLVQPLKPARTSEPRDTTSEHKKHLFDSNCKICTGKMPPPRDEERHTEVKRVKFSAYMESRARQAAEAKTAKQADDVKSSEKDEQKVGVGFYREIVTASHALPPFTSYNPIDPKEIQVKTVPTATTIRAPAPVRGTKPELKLDPRLKSASPAKPVVSEQVAHAAVTVKVDSPVVELDVEPLEPSTVSTTTTISSPDSALQSGLDKKPQFPPSQACVWKGFVFMQDLAKFFSMAYCVSGNAYNLSKDLPDTVQVCGRINPEQVWDYLSRVQHSSTREMVIIRFQPASPDENNNYVQLYSYLSGRHRCGVAGNIGKIVKDMYIVPLAAQSRIPSCLLPFEGPGLGDNRPHMLLGVIVRQSRRPRPAQQQFKPVELEVGLKPKVALSTPGMRPGGLVQLPNIPIPKVPPPLLAAGAVGPTRIRDPRLARQQGHRSVHKMGPQKQVRGTVIPLQPDRPNTPPLHLMPLDQPYAKDLAASAYSVDLGAASEPSSEDDEDHDHIIRQFGKPSASTVFTSTKPVKKPALKPTTEAEDAAPYSPSMIDLDDEDDEPYEPGDDLELDLGVPKPAGDTAAAASASAAPATLLAGLTNLNMASILDKISTSNIPQEMTAAMVATLAATTSSTGLEEQKKLLLELSAKVEEQKKMLEKKKGEKKKILGDTADGEESPSTESTAAVTSTVTSVTTDTSTPTTVTKPLEQAVKMAQETALEARTEPETVLLKAEDPGVSQTVKPLVSAETKKDVITDPVSFYKDLYVESVPNLARKRLAQKINIETKAESPPPENSSSGVPVQAKKSEEGAITTKPEPAEGKKEVGNSSVAPETIPLPADTKKDVGPAEPAASIASKEESAGSSDMEGVSKEEEEVVVNKPELLAVPQQPANIAILPDTIQKLFADHSLQDLRNLVGLAQCATVTSQNDTTPPTSTVIDLTNDQTKHAKQEKSVTDVKEVNETDSFVDDQLEAAMNDPGGMFEVMRKQTEALFGPSKWVPSKTSSSDVPKQVRFSAPEDSEKEEDAESKEEDTPIWKPAPSHIPPELRPSWKLPSESPKPKDVSNQWEPNPASLASSLDHSKTEVEAEQDLSWKGQFGTTDKGPPWRSPQPSDQKEVFSDSHGSGWGQGFGSSGSHHDRLQPEERSQIRPGPAEDDAWESGLSRPSKKWGTDFLPRSHTIEREREGEERSSTAPIRSPWEWGPGQDDRGPPGNTRGRGRLPPRPSSSLYGDARPDEDGRPQYPGPVFEKTARPGPGSFRPRGPAMEEQYNMGRYDRKPVSLYGGPPQLGNKPPWESATSFSPDSKGGDKAKIPSIFDIDIKVPESFKNKDFKLEDSDITEKEEKVKAEPLDNKPVLDKKDTNGNVSGKPKTKDVGKDVKVSKETSTKTPQGIRFSIASSVSKTLPLLSKTVDMETLTSLKPEVKLSPPEISKPDNASAAFKIGGKAGWKPIGQDSAASQPEIISISDEPEKDPLPDITVPVLVGDIPLPGIPDSAAAKTDSQSDSKKEITKHSRSRSHSQDRNTKTKSLKSEKGQKDKRSRSRSRDRSRRDRRSRSKSRDKARRRSRSRERHHSHDASPARGSRKDHDRDRYRNRDSYRRSPQRSRDNRRSPDRTRSQRRRSPDRRAKDRRQRSRSRSRDRKGSRSKDDSKTEQSSRGKSSNADATKDSEQKSRLQGGEAQQGSTDDERKDSKHPVQPSGTLRSEPLEIQLSSQMNEGSADISGMPPSTQYLPVEGSTRENSDSTSAIMAKAIEMPPELPPFGHMRGDAWRRPPIPPPGIFPGPNRNPDHRDTARLQEEMKRHRASLEEKGQGDDMGPPPPKRPREMDDHDSQRDMYLGRPPFRSPPEGFGGQSDATIRGPSDLERLPDNQEGWERRLQDATHGLHGVSHPDSTRDGQSPGATAQERRPSPFSPPTSKESSVFIDHRRLVDIDASAHSRAGPQSSTREGPRESYRESGGPPTRMSEPFPPLDYEKEEQRHHHGSIRDVPPFRPPDLRPPYGVPPLREIGKDFPPIDLTRPDWGPPPRERNDGRPLLPGEQGFPYGPPPDRLSEEGSHPEVSAERHPPHQMPSEDEALGPRRPSDQGPLLRMPDGRGPPALRPGEPGLPPRRPDDRAFPPRRTSDEAISRRHPDRRSPSPRRAGESESTLRRPDERGPPRRSDNQGLPRRPDERGPPRRPDDQGLPRRPDERGPPRRPDDQGLPRRPDERGPPRRPDDQGLPRRPDERGPPRRPDDQGLPRRPDERGPPRRPDDQGLPRRPDERGPPRRPDDQGLPRRPDDRDFAPRRPEDRYPPPRGMEDLGPPPRRPHDESPPRRPDEHGPPPRRLDERGPLLRRLDDRGLPPRRLDDRGLPRRPDIGDIHRTSEERDHPRRPDERYEFHGRSEDRGPPPGRAERGPPPRMLPERGPASRPLHEGGPSRESADRNPPPRRPHERDLEYELLAEESEDHDRQAARPPRGPPREGLHRLRPDLPEFEDLHREGKHLRPHPLDDLEHYRSFPERGPPRMERIPPFRELPLREPPYDRLPPNYPRDFPHDREDRRPPPRSVFPVEAPGRPGPPARDIERDRGFPAGPPGAKASDRPTPERSRGPSPSSESSSVSSESRRGSRPPSADPDLHLAPSLLGPGPDPIDSEYLRGRPRPLPPHHPFTRDGLPFPPPPGPRGPPGEHMRPLLPAPPPPLLGGFRPPRPDPRAYGAPRFPERW